MTLCPLFWSWYLLPRQICFPLVAQILLVGHLCLYILSYTIMRIVIRRIKSSVQNRYEWEMSRHLLLSIEHRECENKIVFRGLRLPAWVSYNVHEFIELEGLFTVGEFHHCRSTRARYLLWVTHSSLLR